MRTWIAIGLLAGSLAAYSPASAQSLPGTGPSIGFTSGYGWGGSRQRDEFIPPPPVIPQNNNDGNYDVRGGSIGLAAGYGFLLNQWLLGVEADINLADIDGSSSACGGTHRCGTELEGYGTLRGRVGTYLGTSTLIYATGGLAVGRIHAYDRLDPSFEGTKTKAGWTVGAGLEQKLVANWSMKLEYLYMDFGRDEYFTIPNFTPERVDLDLHTVRLGLTYSFNDPGPARDYRPMK